MGISTANLAMKCIAQMPDPMLIPAVASQRSRLERADEGDATIKILERQLSSASGDDKAAIEEQIKTVGEACDLADTITVVVYGQVIASGTPADIRASRAVQEAYLGALTE